MHTKHDVVLPYDEVWKQNFHMIRNEIQEALGELALKIEHVGSTSVKGLSAKPIIDVDIVIESNSKLDAVIAALEKNGYQHEGDLGIAGREAFRYDGKVDKDYRETVCSMDVEGSDYVIYDSKLRNGNTSWNEKMSGNNASERRKCCGSGGT